MTHVNSRVQKHRDAKRRAGERLVQIWVPDTRAPGFAEECRRQSLLVAAAEARDDALMRFIEAATDDALADVEPWDE